MKSSSLHLGRRALLFILVLAVGQPAEAQERALIPGPEGNFTISTKAVVNLPFTGLPMAPDGLATAFELPGGGWAVSSGTFDGLVQTFDASGTPAGTFGGSGEGPGEFAGPVFGMSVGDEIWTVDPRNARISVFAADLLLLSDINFSGRTYSASPSLDGSAVYLSGFLGDGGEMHGVARVSIEDGATILGGPISDDPNPRVQIHYATAVPNGEVWTVATQGGALNILDGQDLRLLERLQLPGEELARTGRPQPGDTRPPNLAGLMADSTGIVWVLFGVHDRNWEAGAPTPEEIDQMLDTRVLAINASRREVVATGVFEGLCLPVSGRLVSCVDEADQVVRIIEMNLEEAGESQ